jgi:hypothetical protein
MQLVVSTHFDDAALSLAHVLQRAAERATVFTVCARTPPGDLAVSDWDARSGFAPATRVAVYADLPYAGLHGYALPRAVAAALPGLRLRDAGLRGESFQRKLEAVRCHASQLTALSESAPGLLDPNGLLARERTWTA